MSIIKIFALKSEWNGGRINDGHHIQINIVPTYFPKTFINININKSYQTVSQLMNLTKIALSRYGSIQ